MSSDEISQYYCKNCGKVQPINQGNECKRCKHKTDEISIKSNYEIKKYRRNIKIGLLIAIVFFIIFPYYRLNAEIGEGLTTDILIISLSLFFIGIIGIIYSLYEYAQLRKINIRIKSEIRQIGYKKYGEPKYQGLKRVPENLCPTCGTKINPDWQACPKCGSEFQ